MDAKRRYSSGSVVTVEGIGRDHRPGIAWYADGSGKEIGFAYDRDATAEEDVAQKVLALCADHGLKPFGDPTFPRRVFSGEVEPRFESLSQEEFLDRFGAYPSRAFAMFDEGGSIDSPAKLFGVPENADLASHEETRTEMRSTAVKAGLLTALAFACAIALVGAAATLSASATGTAPGTVMVIFAAILLIGFGAWSLISSIAVLAGWLYRALYRRLDAQTADGNGGR